MTLWRFCFRGFEFRVVWGVMGLIRPGGFWVSGISVFTWGSGFLVFGFRGFVGFGFSFVNLCLLL